MKRSADISRLLRPLDSCRSQACLSDCMQVADVLQWVLEQIGPADVRISSFSISEEFLRRLFFIRKKGLVKSLDVVLDLKATNKTLILWPFIVQTVRNCFLTQNHSKVLLVDNEKASVAVVTSQNLTRGNRLESYFISSEPEVFSSLSETFDDVVNNNSVPIHELFERSAGAD